MAHYYPKIKAPFVRDPATKKMTSEYSDPYAKLLDHFDNWVFTEKIDGTSTLVHWDGDRVHFYGHTTKSQIPQKHLDWLNSKFGTPEFESLLEQNFADKPVSLYGELFGADINKGEKYSDEYQFFVFDIQVGALVTDSGVEKPASWLDWSSVKEICKSLSINHVPEVQEEWGVTTLLGASTAVQHFNSIVAPMLGKPPFPCEGVVARPKAVFLTREGTYIRYKIKRRDYVHC